MKSEIAKFIDHTIYKTSATSRDIQRLCQEAELFNFRAICVNLGRVELAAKNLGEKRDIKISAIIDFPLGANGLESKIDQAKFARRYGADEIDTVLNLGNFFDRSYDLIEKEIKEINSILPTKFIIEHAILNDSDLLKISGLLEKNKAFALKLASGFIDSGHELKIRHIKAVKAGFPKLRIKASGGISSIKEVLELIEVGASFIGTSSAKKIMEEYPV
jgi:deoxyribose-phosphate aldolase